MSKNDLDKIRHMRFKLFATLGSMYFIGMLGIMHIFKLWGDFDIFKGWTGIVMAGFYSILMSLPPIISLHRRLKRLKKDELLNQDYLPFQHKMIQSELAITEVLEKLMSYDATKKWTLTANGDSISGKTEKGKLFVKTDLIEIEKTSDVLLLSSRPKRGFLLDNGSNFYNIIKMERAILGDNISITDREKSN